MFNTYQFNTVQFNQIRRGAVPTPVVVDPIVFNNFSLQNDEVVTSILLHDSTPERDFTTRRIPRDDGRNIISDFWDQKFIEVTGFVRQPTASAMATKIDAMKKALSLREGNLDIQIDGTTRRFISTLVNGQEMFRERKGHNITIVPYSARFACLTPYGQDVDFTSDSKSPTILVFSEQLINNGTATAKLVVSLTLSAATSRPTPWTPSSTPPTTT